MGDLLRLATAGSVDDGKSTLVGRLLYDTKSVLADQLDAIHRASVDRGLATPDLSLLVDGLRSEREQGITIDVAYRYFATPHRSFILADTPGHVQYTRNTVTGASTAQLAILLVDARKGVLEQTRRHAAVLAMLGVPRLVLAVNKIDLVGYEESTFSLIAKEFLAHATRAGLRREFGDRDSGVGAGRRQRGRAVRQHALVLRTDPAAPPGDGAGRTGPARRAVPLPGAVRDPAAHRRATRTTAVTRGRSRRARSASATRSWCCRTVSAARSAGSTPRTAR